MGVVSFVGQINVDATETFGHDEGKFLDKRVPWCNRATTMKDLCVRIAMALIVSRSRIPLMVVF